MLEGVDPEMVAAAAEELDDAALRGAGGEIARGLHRLSFTMARRA